VAPGRVPAVLEICCSGIVFSTVKASFSNIEPFSERRSLAKVPPVDFEKAKTELPILRNFIDFLNRQVGVYCDCLTSFSGNKVRIERQIPRAQRPAGRRIENGRPVIVWASVEDPTLPDIIHHRIIRSDEFISANSEAGFNEQQLCWSIIVLVFAYWDEEIRPQIAKVRGVKPNAVMLDELGDLRILRKCIVHNGGVISPNEYSKLKIMTNLCRPDEKLMLTHEQMHRVFVYVKQAIARLILEYSGHLPGAPKASELGDVAIQNS
jgi:hypothetical protein